MYPARVSFKIDGEIKCFSEKQRLREFSTTKPALQQMLGTYIVKKYKREGKKKKDLQNQPQTTKKMAIGMCVCVCVCVCVLVA